MLFVQDNNYVPFDFQQEEPLFSMQRKLLPNSM
jgi:hypothetical protein